MTNHKIFNPEKTIFVSASAGAGKTTLLVKKYLSYIICGVECNKILCMTFTRNAAYEMKERIIDQIMKMLSLDEGSLSLLIEKELGLCIEGKIIKQRIIAIIDNPELLRAETLHSYCYKLVQKYAVEVNLPIMCKIIDPTQEIEMAKESLQKTLKMIGEADIELLQSFYHFFSERKVLDDSKNISDKSDFIITKPGKFSELKIEIDSIQNNFLKIMPLHNKSWQEAEGFYLTQKGEKRAKLFNKNFEKENPDDAMTLTNLQNEFCEVRNKCLSMLNSYAQTLYAFVIRLFLEEFKKFRLDKALITFSEVIDYALLLTNSIEYKESILYDLDHSFDHLMLDEAQDTNFKQWEIIKSLTADFFAGDSAKNVPRSIFVVGDYKQSIYRFQGAEPSSFFEARNFFKSSVPIENFIELELQNNYRSGTNIINFVNKICNLTEDISPQLYVPQIAQKQIEGAISLVEYDKNLEVAELIARDVKSWLDNGRLIAGEQHPVKASDIMILFRSRNQLYDKLISALDSLGIGYSGDERFLLSDHLFIQDLISIAEFCINPYDDLNLACLLRSPYFRVQDNIIEDLCFDRKESLFNELQKHPETKEVLNKFHYILQNDFCSTREFFRKILIQPGFILAYINLYGSIIKTIYQNFWQVLYKAPASLSLNQFVNYLRQLDFVISSDQSEDNKIKFMTIHGAKGLESKIVIIPDIKSTYKGRENYVIKEENFYFKIDNSVEHFEFDKIISEYEIEDSKEYFRLGYVAFTRAQNELHLYGDFLEEDEKNSWHYLAKKALIAEKKLIKNHQEDICRYTIGDIQNFSKKSQDEIFENQKVDFFNISFPEMDFVSTESPSKKEDQISPVAEFYSKVTFGINYHKLFQLWKLIDNKKIVEKYNFSYENRLIGEVKNLFLEENEYFHELSFAKIDKKDYNCKVTRGVIDLIVKNNNNYQVIEIKSAFNPSLSEAYNKQLKAYGKILEDTLKVENIKKSFYFAGKIKEVTYVN